MQLIEITLNDFSRRCRSVSVGHFELGLARSLEYGERVLVLSGGEYRTAVVNDVSHDAEDTHYQLALGGLLPAEKAAERLAGSEPATPGSIAPVLHLSERSTGSAPRIPAQRGATASHLTD